MTVEQASAVLADVEDRVVDETVAVLTQRDQAPHRSNSPEECRRKVRQLFGLVLRCMREGRAEPIIKPSEQIAVHCFTAGVDLAGAQATSLCSRKKQMSVAMRKSPRVAMSRSPLVAS